MEFPADYADNADLRGWGLWGLVAILILNTYFKTLKKVLRSSAGSAVSAGETAFF